MVAQRGEVDARTGRPRAASAVTHGHRTQRKQSVIRAADPCDGHSCHVRGRCAAECCLMLRTALVLLCITTAGQAQEVDLSVRPPTDSAVSRAHQLVLADRGTEGRKLVDSVLTSSADNESLYGE